MIKNKDIPCFVKWAGGKGQLLEQFEKFYPKNFDGYLEPFLGSGAVFFSIRKNYKPDKIVLSDNNYELINCYLVVRDNLDELIDLLKVHKRNHNKRYYYKIRDLNAGELSKVEKAARLLYLNKTCFNGLYRVNSKGKFNVPIGSYKNPNIVNDSNLRAANLLLQNVIIKVQSFEKILDDAEKGDFIYLDPPYHPLSKTASFTGYTSDAFSEKNQEALAKVYKKLDKKGCLLMLSNSDTEFIRAMYSDFNIYEVKARRAINCDGKKRGLINEIVVLNY